MATRQYIGARYVPKFYQNSVDGSAQWESNVVYEPLMFVTLTNSHMYISKKQVPATVGSPVSNIEYWLDIGSYNGFIEQLQDEIDALTASVALKQDITDNSLTTTVKTIVGAINELVSGKQNKTDNTLATTDKTVVGAINELDGEVDTINATLTLKQNATDNNLATTDKTVVGAVNELVSGIQTLTNKAPNIAKVLVVSDSYTNVTNTGWDEVFEELSEITEFYNLRGSGYGFSRSGYKFLDLLTNAASLIDNKETFTDIIVGAGANDVGVPVGTLKTDIQAFKSYCKTNYPNAKLHIAFVSWSTDRTTGGSMRAACFNYRNICATLGIDYFKGVEAAMHNMTYFNTIDYPDGIHPNQSGNDAIGGAIAQAFRGHSNVFVAETATFTAGSEGSSNATYLFNSQICGDVQKIQTSQLDYTFTNSHSAGSQVQIGTYNNNTVKMNTTIPITSLDGHVDLLTLYFDGRAVIYLSRAITAGQSVTWFVSPWYNFDIMQN